MYHPIERSQCDFQGRKSQKTCHSSLHLSDHGIGVSDSSSYPVDIPGYADDLLQWSDLFDEGWSDASSIGNTVSGYVSSN
jgi:hypothetical protein